MSLGTVLVVEDDAPIRRGLVDALQFAGYAPLEAGDGRSGLETALRGTCDLVLLDIQLPELDGFTVLTELRRARPTLPIILLTARGAEEDRVRGLRSGADDYVVKPFSTSELLARVEAVLRRSPERPDDIEALAIAGRTIDFARREARLADGSCVSLTDRETGLVRYLAANPGRAISREELLRAVWGLDPRGVQTRTVDMHVARLREHLGDDSSNPEVLVTVRGKGYMIAGPAEAGPGDEGAA